MATTHTGNGRDSEHDEARANLADKSLTTLAADLARDTRHLIELEIEAAKLDVRDEIQTAKQAAGSAAIGGAVAGVGALFLLLAVVFVLYEYTELALWGAFAIVGGAMAIAGGVALLFGASRASQLEVPGKRAALEAKEDVKWISEHASATR